MYVPGPGVLTLAGPCVALLPERCVLGTAKAIQIEGGRKVRVCFLCVC